MTNIARRPSGRWRARYRDDVGKEHSRHCSRKVDAQVWLDQVTAAIVTGQCADPKAGKTSLRSYAVGWEASQVASEATARMTDNALRLHILPVLGDRPMGSIRPSEVQSWVKELSAALAPGSVRNIYDVVARMFSASLEDRVVPVTPCRKIKLPQLNTEEVTPPTVDQVTRMVEQMPIRHRVATVLLAGSGLRIGEVLGLRVADIDFLRKTIRVERQRLQSGRISAPKSKKSIRTVPVGHVVLDALALHLAEYPSDEWLFLKESGDPLDYMAWQSLWLTARKGCKSEMNTHDLRHFFASALIAGGASVKQVQMVLGHSSPMITLRYYAHLWPGDEDRTRAVIDTTLIALRTTCGLQKSDEVEVPTQTG